MTSVPCRAPSADPDMWFSVSPIKIARAVRLCSQCPLKTACATEALANAEPHGVWGGLTETDRRALTATRRRTHGRAA